VTRPICDSRAPPARAPGPHPGDAHRARAARLRCTAALAIACIAAAAHGQEPRSNYFNDPFLQVTNAINGCPVPDGPLITRTEMQREAHARAERGTRCFEAGFCRLPNAYQYDREIIARVSKAIEYETRFADTSVWVEGRRRWVWLKGCVRRKADAQALEKLVRRIDDVEAVVDELVVR
jgi:BON domain-containing protein